MIIQLKTITNQIRQEILKNYKNTWKDLIKIAEKKNRKKVMNIQNK